MVPGRHDEHTDDVHRDADDDGLRGYSGPERCEAGEVDEEERNGVRIDDVVVSFFGGVSERWR